MTGNHNGLLIGLHVSMAGGLSKTLERIKRLRLESVQIFSGNPRAFKSKPIDPALAEAFRGGLADFLPGPLIVHAPYPMNLASPDRANRKRSIDMLITEMERGRLLGGSAVVFHPGNHLGGGVRSGQKLIAEAIKTGLDRGPDGIVLAVENTSGSGTSIGGVLEELAGIMNLADGGERVGCWLDTAHAFGAGYDLSRPSGVDDFVDLAEQIIGLGRLAGLHINDSKADLGSGKDRHEHLGLGLIGAAGLGRVLAHEKLTGLPGILETPRESEDDEKADLRRARLYRTRASTRAGTN